MDLTELGWNGFFEAFFNELDGRDVIPARVAVQHRDVYTVFSEAGEITARISGKIRYEATSKADYPAVGDWVAVSPTGDGGNAVIRATLPRRTYFSRKAILAGGTARSGGKTEEQVIASNVDVVFLVTGLDGDYSIRRIERYLALAWESGASPVVVLNKTDVCEDLKAQVDEVEQAMSLVPVYATSAKTGEGMNSVRSLLAEGKTGVLLGSSGVGKSTIINHFLGREVLAVKSVREYDSRGRHTTTKREMVLLPGGGIVIDTPGMREIALWTDQQGVNRAFDDIEQLAECCRFRDCRHRSEPGCAVRDALEDGSLDPSRYKNYLKLKREAAFVESRQTRKARIEEKARGKRIAKTSRSIERAKQRAKDELERRFE
jgi:ribosome biogenesis GTPase